MRFYFIVVISIAFMNSAHSFSERTETWICKSERFGKIKWEIKGNYIYEVIPSDDANKYKITKRSEGISLFGEAKGGAIWDLDAYLDYNDKMIKVRQLDRKFGISGEYYNTNCEIFK